ncbi:MAG: hypothetical protein HGA22_15305, partial [Clostridiales bacterium]|nr:hypothetical protein [Clostridiales bacterium]
MNNRKNNSEAIIKRLFTFSQLDEKLMEYYLKHGHVVNEDEFAELLYEYPTNDLRNFTKAPEDYIRPNPSEVLLVKGSILFDQGLDIFLIRHPCFSSDNVQN